MKPESKYWAAIIGLTIIIVGLMVAYGIAFTDTGKDLVDIKPMKLYSYGNATLYILAFDGANQFHVTKMLRAQEMLFNNGSYRMAYLYWNNDDTLDDKVIFYNNTSSIKESELRDIMELIMTNAEEVEPRSIVLGTLNIKEYRMIKHLELCEVDPTTTERSCHPYP